MKSILIVGLGDFGHHLCRNFARLKNEIMVVDKDEEALEDLLDVATSSLIADCTQTGVLQRLGVSNFDICFVCIDGSFEDSLIVTSRLKELGAKYVVSQSNDEILSGFLLKNGADEVIYPNRDTAVRVAVKHNNDHVFDYIDLKDGYSIYEITPLQEWIGKSILELDIRAKYDIYIVGILHADGKANIMPTPQTVISDSDHLMALSSDPVMDKLLKKMGK